jgi:hypothetical protein
VGMDQNWIAKKHGTVSNTENDHKDRCLEFDPYPD